MKRVLEMKLDLAKYDALKQMYTLGNGHSQVIRHQMRTMRYIPAAL